MQRWGPQPPEAVLSILLQEFPAYTVRELLAEDWLILERILDYRTARAAIDLFNGGERGFEQLQQRPAMLQILLEMGRAQAGAGVTLDQVYTGLRKAQPARDDD